ncbi:MAG: alanine--glyoxylate aminotransferase family protein [Candidatus Latescibacteria bacterium]|jgi:serine---pyruvate transaminase|nr:alanine--glyoxylate aminotransferase family protein [Candidatus Latescibacterota bacterium]
MKTRLFTPGPVMVPEKVLLKMAEPVFHHRTPEYENLFAKINEKLKKFFMTDGDVFTLASSGTGAMETAVVNVLARGDKAVTVRGGKFGERWDEICRAYGIETVQVDVEWGRAVDPEEIKNALDANPGVKAVFTTHSETSTGVLTDLKAIGEVMRDYDAALVTDAVSGIGAHELRPDEWGIDIVVSGSQKTIMLPPGLGFISVSKDSWKRIERSDLPKYYWDIMKYKKSIEMNQNPFTPPITLLVGLNESLDIILGEGLENLWARHALAAQAMRAGVRALGLDLFPTNPSNVLSAISIPEGIDGGLLVKTLKKNGIFPAGGQAHLKGKIIRISHIGYLDEYDVLSALSGLELSLKEVGFSFNSGDSVKAAQEVLADR